MLDAMDQTLAVRRVSDGRRFELGHFLFFGIEPIGVEQVQAISLADLAMQQLQNALATFLGIRMRDAHDVLRGVAITETGAAADLNERSKTRPNYAGLGLIERPGVDHGVEAGMRRLALKNFKFLLPVISQCLKCQINIS